MVSIGCLSKMASGGGRRGAKRVTQQETHSLDARREDAEAELLS
jgi:hypothetical protein